MKYIITLIFTTVLFSLPLFAQTNQRNSAENTNSAPKTETKITENDEKAELEKAIALKIAAERISALQKFITDYPQSAEKQRALELIVSARAEIAAEKLRLGKTEEGLELFKLAVKEAPTPISDKLFESVLLQIPTNIFLRGQRAAAFDIAKTLEDKIGNNVRQILGLATFYIGIEYSTAARELAEKAIEIDPNSAVAYQTLGLAYRLGFNLPNAAGSYVKALELDPNSAVSKRSLAEMKRALGDTDEAIRLYREVLGKNEKDIIAKTGLILSLFDSGKQREAEGLMKTELETNPKNVPLLVGAAYWYAAQNDGKKAVELANQALQIEPRYTWGYIALARGLMKQNNPLAAETALLNARRFGKFPTISYELALAQTAAGFYKEAAEELDKNFSIEKGKIVTSLGGRVDAEGDNFIELLSLERKAVIFEPTAANELENAEKLKALLEFENKLSAENADETELAKAAENFAKGDDAMKTHRHLFAANELLEKKKALPKALELTQAAVGGVESAINVSSPSSAVLAEELYEPRTLAKTKGQNVAVPDIPPAILSRIIRGKIEETAGWTLYEQGKYEESLDKLNLAKSILPENSSWWRSTLWRQGTVLEALKKPEQALDSYIKSYASEIANTAAEPSSVKKVVVENLYRRINGNLDGLDEKLSAMPKTSTDATAAFVKKPVADEKTENPQKSNKKIPKIVPIAKTAPKNAAIVEEDKSALNKTDVETAVESTPNPVSTPTEAVENSEINSTNVETSINTSPTPVETEVDKKPKEEETKTISSVENPPVKTSVENKSPMLFEPVIINIPKTDAKKNEKSEETIDENSTTQENLKDGDSAEIKENKVEETAEVSECEITVSREEVSITNGGGSVGVQVGLKDRDEPQNIKAASSSPEDIEVVYEPEIGAADGQAFFTIKSVTSKKGTYTVTFDTPCGKKEIPVKVR